MATREELVIATTSLAYLTACQRDLRANALAYKAEIASPTRTRTTAQLGAIVHADGAAISRLLQRMTDFFSDAGRRTKATNGLAFYGILFADAKADHDSLQAVADTQSVANVSTDTAIIAAADATLANVTAIDVLA